MDIASVIGALLGVGATVLVMWKASHGDWSMFYSEKGLIMVGGGTVSVLLMAMPMDKIISVGGYIKRFMFHKATSPVQIVKLFGELSEKARRDGLLSLESELAKIKDPAISSGLRMAVDGAHSDVIEQTFRMEILAMQDRHKAGKKFFDLIKVYAPGYGLVATLIGQIGMFGHLGGDIKIMGHMLAVAVVATMYACILANAVAGPIGDKLALRSGEEIVNREMILQGILSIQSGDNPRMTVEKMTAFLPMGARVKAKANQ